MKKILLLFSFAILFNAFTFGQASVSLPDITATPGSDISVPIDVTGFSNLGAISLIINYDPNVITFQSNPDPITAGNFFINDINGQIRIGWFGTTPLNITDGVLLHLNFNYLGGTTNLEFVETTSTSIANTEGAGIPTTYKNGSVSSPTTLPQTGSIGDYVWNDLDSNGIQRDKTLEPPLENVTVKLFDVDADPTLANPPLQETVTDSNGNYQFSNLFAGNYKVKFELLDGYVFSPKKVNYPTSQNGDSDADSLSGLSDVIALSDSEHIYGIDAGMYVSISDPMAGSIEGLVWDDGIGGNGIFDGLGIESGISGVSVNIIKVSNNPGYSASTTTDNNGNYKFENLSPGGYEVTFTLPSGYSFANNNTSLHTITLNEGDNVKDINAGMFYTPPPPVYASVGDFVWEDINKDGIQDNGELGIKDVVVKLLDANNSDAELFTTATDNQGKYSFNNVPAGSYKVSFTLPTANYFFSPKNASTSTDANNSDVDPSTGITDAFTLNEGDALTNIDAGMYDPPPVVSTPDPTITVSDGVEVSPDSGLTTTYTINYGNDGSADLLNSNITATIPTGYSYVSSNGGISSAETSTNIVEFQIGTIAMNTSGSVTLIVKVTNIESDYLLYVELNGIDNNIPTPNSYTASAKDLNLYDETSGGGDAGLESKGDLAALLLKRQLLIRYERTTPMLAVNKSNSISAQHNLEEFYPVTGP
ncbi:MAG: hypothetical protein COW08_02925, partial [Ignavibacteriales bacterium CG12_big_fil_rev_8_21_14_0_65_30_8]